VDFSSVGSLSVSHELEGRHRNGSLFPVDLSVREVPNANWVLFVAVLHDLTAQKKIDHMKTQFISVVSNELRTPMTSVLGSLGLIRGGAAGEVPDSIRSMVDIAYNNSERLVHLINDILDVERIESGLMTFKTAPVDLVELCERAVANNVGYGKSRGVSVSFRSGVSSAVVDGDGDRLNQVLANLLSNAAKVSATGGEVIVALAPKGDDFLVEVSDSGPGIPDDVGDRVFERFFQIDGSDSRRASGTGLGLGISKAIVEGHGGVIGFSNRATGGAVFHISLPAKPDRL